MITPGIVKRALVRAAQWRLFLFAPLVLLVPAVAAMLPIGRVLHEQLDHVLNWKELTPRLDSTALLDLVKQLGTPQAGAQLTGGVQIGLLLTLFLSPLLAGAALTAARSEEAPRARDLLQGAGSLYGRLLRMQVASVLPYGLAFAAIAGLGVWQGKLVDKAITQSSTVAPGRAVAALTVLLLLLANLCVDAGRAWLLAQPARKSALFALGAGVKLVVRRPVAALSLAASTSLIGMGLAALLILVRQQLTQASGPVVFTAFLLGLLASALVAYGHSARLCGLVELALSDLADRTKVPAPFEMEPPKTSPPPARVPTTLPVDYGPTTEPDPVALISAATDPITDAATQLFAPLPTAPKPEEPVAAPVFTPLAAPELSFPPPAAAPVELAQPASAAPEPAPNEPPPAVPLAAPPPPDPGPRSGGAA